MTGAIELPELERIHMIQMEGDWPRQLTYFKARGKCVLYAPSP